MRARGVDGGTAAPAAWSAVRSHRHRDQNARTTAGGEIEVHDVEVPLGNVAKGQLRLSR